VSRSQLKIAAVLVALVLLVVGVSGALVERDLRASELSQIAQTLEAKALLIRELVGDTPFDVANSAALDAVADRAEAAAGVRVTLIDRCRDSKSLYRGGWYEYSAQ
jgi:cytochrome c556